MCVFLHVCTCSRQEAMMPTTSRMLEMEIDKLQVSFVYASRTCTCILCSVHVYCVVYMYIV